MKKNGSRIWKAIGIGCLALMVMFTLFHLLYLYDNKYTAAPPYGSDGVFPYPAEGSAAPMFLIDGWEFYPDVHLTPDTFKTGNVPVEQYVFIGQFSNFSYIENGHSPFGRATYRLMLDYDGPARPCAMEIPEIFTDYILWIDGVPAVQNKSSTMVDFILQGDTELVLHVENRSHYYSGLYYPPAIGSPTIVSDMLLTRNMFYGVLSVCAFTLALFSSVLWISKEHDALFLHFGLLCLSFFVTVLHPFVHAASLSGRLWYALEDTARLLMLVQTIHIGAILSDCTSALWYRRRLCPVLHTLCLVPMASVIFIIPVFGTFINIYGIFIDVCTLFGWLLLCIFTARGFVREMSGFLYALAGSVTLGASFLANLLNNNRFEPIYTGWQTEYAGFLLVLIFGAYMVQRNREFLQNNRFLVTHMEELVQERTSELYTVLEERKNFFQDMAHNLKAPIAAVHGFINLIREGNLYLDEELRTYIHMIESENEEMHLRVQALHELNALDMVTAPSENLDVDELLEKVYFDNAPDAGAMGISLHRTNLSHPVSIRGQREKLLILFENLIYNAISFTPQGGRITISPTTEKDHVLILVSDTGTGLSPEHLPHIFERFYVGRDNPKEGSGLGLYIARMTIEEIGGTIRASSVPGEGSTFIIQLPISECE